jgi:hypothetical protein
LITRSKRGNLKLLGDSGLIGRKYDKKNKSVKNLDCKKPKRSLNLNPRLKHQINNEFSLTKKRKAIRGIKMLNLKGTGI